MITEWQQVLDIQPCAGGFEMGGGHAARQLHADVHDGLFRALKEIADSGGADDIGDLMRIADRGGDAARQHAAVELMRCDQRAFDMQMGVDEPGYDDLAGDVDCVDALIAFQCSHNAIATDGDIALAQLARGQVEQSAALQDNVSRRLARALVDHVTKSVCHGLSLFAACPNQEPAGFSADRSSLAQKGDYILSVMSEVQAPSGSLVMMPWSSSALAVRS